jgi:hypothetical protein
VLQKLAPELRIGKNGWTDVGFAPQVNVERIADVGLRVNGDCCLYTFAEDPGTPFEEKILTVYLWKKLFPERFRTRPRHSPLVKLNRK